MLRLQAILCLCFVLVIGWSVHARGDPSRMLHPFFTLQERLIQDGFDRSLIQSIYCRSEAVFDEQGLTAYFLHREATLDYDQFLTRSSIGRAIDYLKKHSRALQQAQKVYGVDGEIVTAILLVESRLGKFIDKRPVLRTLSSLAALDEAAKRDMLWHTHVEGKVSGSRDQFEKWARRKSTWAYTELKAYLRYVKAQNIDPFSVYGSYAGALGFAQFVPSSVLKFGQDGNKDGQINLYQHMDAIDSVANYLKEHGWKPGLGQDEAFRVLLSYNHSKYYVEIILKVAQMLKG